MIVWYQLGISVGVISSNEKDTRSRDSSKQNKNTISTAFNDRMDIALSTHSFDLIDDTEGWLTQLQKSIDVKPSSLKGIKEFLCCLVSKNQRSKKYTLHFNQSLQGDLPKDKRFRCHAISKLKTTLSESPRNYYTRKISRLKEVVSGMRCDSRNLTYKLTISS